jgi:hypothetical protein
MERFVHRQRRIFNYCLRNLQRVAEIGFIYQFDLHQSDYVVPDLLIGDRVPVE